MAVESRSARANPLIKMGTSRRPMPSAPDRASLVEGDAAGGLGGGGACYLLKEDGDELDRDDEDQDQLVDRNSDPRQGAEDQLQPFREIHERGREHEHGRDVVDEDDAEAQNRRILEPLRRDREYPPLPQVVGNVPGVEEDLEEQDKEQEAEKELGAPKQVAQGDTRRDLYQGEERECYCEAEKVVYQERGGQHHDDGRDLEAGVEPMDHRPRIHELPEDDVALELEH